jgi:hypothetical protein
MASSLVPRRDGRGCRPGAGPALRVATHAARCRACELGLVRAQAPRAARRRRRPGAGAAAAHLPGLPPQGARALLPCSRLWRASAPARARSLHSSARARRWPLLHGVWRSHSSRCTCSYLMACACVLQGSRQVSCARVDRAAYMRCCHAVVMAALPWSAAASARPVTGECASRRRCRAACSTAPRLCG